MHHMNIISHIYDRFLIALPLSSHAKILYTSEKVREGGQEPHASRQGRAFRLAQRKFLTSGLVPRFSPHKQQRSWLIFKNVSDAALVRTSSRHAEADAS